MCSICALGVLLYLPVRGLNMADTFFSNILALARQNGGTVNVNVYMESAHREILPAGWDIRRSSTTGRNYYANEELGVTTWSAPTSSAAPPRSSTPPRPRLLTWYDIAPNQKGDGNGKGGVDNRKGDGNAKGGGNQKGDDNGKGGAVDNQKGGGNKGKGVVGNGKGGGPGTGKGGGEKVDNKAKVYASWVDYLLDTDADASATSSRSGAVAVKRRKNSKD